MISILKKLFGFQNEEITYSIDAESARNLTERRNSEKYLSYQQRKHLLIKHVYNTIKNSALEEQNCVVIHNDFWPNCSNFIKWDSDEIKWLFFSQFVLTISLSQNDKLNIPTQ